MRRSIQRDNNKLRCNARLMPKMVPQIHIGASIVAKTKSSDSQQFPCPPQRGRERSHPVDESTYNLVYFPYIIEIIKI